MPLCGTDDDTGRMHGARTAEQAAKRAYCTPTIHVYVSQSSHPEMAPNKDAHVDVPENTIETNVSGAEYPGCGGWNHAQAYESVVSERWWSHEALLVSYGVQVGEGNPMPGTRHTGQKTRVHARVWCMHGTRGLYTVCGALGCREWVCTVFNDAVS
jgi:hypothetical protein